VTPDQQGELQGGVASLQSMAAMLGPPLATGAFDRFTRPGALYVPGAPYFLAAGLTLAAGVTIAVFARGVFRRAFSPASGS
jgi:DHA1 family tetracycline resistance protein-like MFS transporter